MGLIEGNMSTSDGETLQHHQTRIHIQLFPPQLFAALVQPSSVPSTSPPRPHLNRILMIPHQLRIRVQILPRLPPSPSPIYNRHLPARNRAPKNLQLARRRLLPCLGPSPKPERLHRHRPNRPGSALRRVLGRRFLRRKDAICKRAKRLAEHGTQRRHARADDGRVELGRGPVGHEDKVPCDVFRGGVLVQPDGAEDGDEADAGGGGGGVSGVGKPGKVVVGGAGERTTSPW